MTPIVFAVPGDLATPTGGYAYDRQVISGLRRTGHQVDPMTLPATFPFPSGSDIDRTMALLASVPDTATVICDGLAWGALPVDRLKSGARHYVALVHHPLALESGLGPADRDQLMQSETLALAWADHVIVTSPTTGRIVTDRFAVPTDRITVAEPGTVLAQRVPYRERTPHIVALGAVVPRKGYDILIEALGLCSDLDWRTSIVGATDRAPDHAAMVGDRIATRGLALRITMTGAISDAERDACLSDADLFVLASHYEGYGMVVAEALAHGLPVVTTDAGAVADVVGPEYPMVPVNDAAALAEALRPMISDPGQRRARADLSWQRAASLPSWDDTVQTISGAVNGLQTRTEALS